MMSRIVELLFAIVVVALFHFTRKRTSDVDQRFNFMSFIHSNAESAVNNFARNGSSKSTQKNKSKLNTFIWTLLENIEYNFQFHF